MTNDIIAKYNNAYREYLDRLTWNGIAQTTISNYETALRLFSDFLATTATDDMYEAIEEWKESMLRNGNAPSTVNQRLTTLNIFFGKATKRSFPKNLRFSDNPVEEIEPVKFSKRPYAETLTDEQIIKLYQNTPYHGARFWARTYAAVMILLNEKLRNSEVTALTLSDIDFRYHEITVRHGKGDKYRVVDMSRLTETAIHAYLESGQRPDYLLDDDYLFGSVRGGKWSRMTRQGLSKLVDNHIEHVCGVEGVRSHALRHVGSRLCLNAGTSLEELQGQLGHAQMSTTAIYSGRLQQRRRRESAQAVLAAREKAAEMNERRISAKTISFDDLKEA